MSVLRHLFPLPTALLLASGVLIVLLVLVIPHRPALPPTASQLALRPTGVTQIDFKRLQLGGSATSYAQATASMGEGGLLMVSPDGRTRRYQWNGGGRWARLEATFHDGYVVDKMQFLLSRN